MIYHTDCFSLTKMLDDKSVDLLLTDPPYADILGEKWDKQWKTMEDYVSWMLKVFEAYKPKLKPHASVIFFGGLGKHGQRHLFRLMEAIEEANLFTYRNMICWKKRRAYGKEFDYLFCREEICWYSMSPERKEVTFNIPLLDVKRGYAGFDKDYPAKSEFKRVSNVWDDIPELMRPVRPAEKPVPLMDRLVKTHSNKGDLIVDPFCGTGTTGVSAVSNGRLFRGCDLDEEAVEIATDRINNASV